MTDYTELVKALRHCIVDAGGFADCRGCPEEGHSFDCETKMHMDAAAAIEALQAKIKRLKEANDELREAQTYIDHYGDKWMTSAKDVPTSAYNHGYMDGKNEAEQALKAERDYYKAEADNWKESADSKERLLGMYRAQNMYSAKDKDGHLIVTQCANMNGSESPNSPENPDS